MAKSELAEEREAVEKETEKQRAAWEEYREDTEERLARRGAQRTIDGNDASLGWTVQSGQGFMDDPSELNGPQKYTPEQLPDPSVAQAAAMQPQAIPESLILRDDDDAFSHPRGPEPGEAERAKKRAAVAERIVEKGEFPVSLDAAAVDAEATSVYGKAMAARREQATAARGKTDKAGLDKDRKESESKAEASDAELAQKSENS